jgi:hypothetical protein
MGKIKSPLIAPLMLLALPAQALACLIPPPRTLPPVRDTGETDESYKGRLSAFWSEEAKAEEASRLAMATKMEADLWDKGEVIALYRISRIQHFRARSYTGRSDMVTISPVKSLKGKDKLSSLRLKSSIEDTSCGPLRMGLMPKGQVGDFVILMAWTGTISPENIRWMVSPYDARDERTRAAFAEAIQASNLKNESKSKAQ